MWQMIAVWLVTTILGELLRPKAKKPKPAGLDEFSFPTATADRKIPVVAGKVRINGPNLTWYGNYRTKSIKVKSGGGLFGGGSKQVVGYRYYVDMHFVLCHGPVDAFTRIAFDNRTAWTGAVKDGQVFIDKPELFGDDDAEGGVQARVDFHSGETAQTPNAHLSAQLGGDIPAWGGLAYLVWHSPGYVGNSPQIRPIVFEVQRLPRPLNSGKHDINGDANPAELLYELHTSHDWGGGMAGAHFDAASFLAAADTLHAEGLGISLVWDQSTTTVEQLAQQVLSHIDGIIYPDPVTGLRTLKLIRQDYVIANLPLLDESNVLSLDKFSRGAWDETTNEVVVSYTDRADDFAQRTVTAQDLANQHIQGAVISASLDYQGASNPTTAQLIAWRELRLRSQPMAQITLQVNRAAHAFRPGDPFRLTWPELGITDMVFRVGQIRYGELTEGRIQLDAVQDLFATDASIYAPTPATGWQSPSQAPAAAPAGAALEAPYWWIAGDPTITDKTTGNLITVAQRPGGDVDGYEIWTRRAAQAFAQRGLAPGFTPTGLLVSALPLATTSTLTLTSGVDLDLLEGADRARGETLLLVDAEWMAYDPAQVVDNGDGTFTFAGVWRGVLDTVPAAHSAGARAWLLAEASGTTADSYPPTDSVDVRMLTITSQGTLPLASAPILSKTFTQRPSRPYPPANVKVNGVAYPSAILGAYTLSWAHRDRLAQQDVIPQTDASIGPEAGTTYTLRLYGETDTLLRTETGLTGTSYTWSDEEADSGLTVPGTGGGADYDTEVGADNPAARWKLDETSGTTAFDAAGSNDGTLTGATLDQEPLIVSGRSVLFSGSSSGITVPDAPELDLPTQFTLRAWLKTTASGVRTIYSRPPSGSPWSSYWLKILSGGTLQAGVRSSNADTPRVVAVTTVTVNDGATHMVDVVFVGNDTFKIYIDDIERASVSHSISLPFASSGALYIGRQSDGSEAYPGTLDELAIFPSALSAARRTAHYNAGIVGAGVDLPRPNGRIRAELESVRGGLTSHQKHNITVDRAGWGYNWGNYWGGI